MRLTPAILAAAYDLLRETPPFSRWNLPEAEDVTFVVTRHPTTMGRHYIDLTGGGRRHVVELSDRQHDYLPSVLATMAHELIHVHEAHPDASGRPRVGGRAEHTLAFRKWAKQVCDAHGFDRGQF